MRIRKASSAILLTLLLAGCRSTLTLDRLTRDLRAGEINTLSLTPRVSLVSPFDLTRTAEFESLIEGEIGLVSDLFELVLDGPVLFVLKPVEVEGFEVTEVRGRLLVKGPPEQPSLHGVGGAAGAGEAGTPAVVIFVAADGTLTTRDGGDVPVVFRFSYVRYLLEEEPPRGFPVALDTIAALDRAELLSREKDWRAWLGAVAGR